VPVTVPSTATTSPTFARFRWSSTQNLNATTAAPDGEVEDYALTILAPPILDLNSAASPADNDRNTSLAFTENDGAQPIMPSANINTRGENDIGNLTIAIQDVFDGDEEVVTIGGEGFALGTNRSVSVTFAGQAFMIDYDASTQTLIFSSDGATAEMDEAALDALLQSMTYEHTGENPTGGDRDYDITILDADGLTSEAVAQITVIPVNDLPALDFDADDSSGATGADYSASYTAGDGAVNMTDTDVSITDADDSELANGSTATFSGFVDSGNEFVTIGGETFIVGASNVQTFTIGNTTFEVDSDGSDFAISVAGGTGELADWEALFESITYENTSATPTPGDRFLAFNVTDPNGGTSNAATSTISVNATPTDLALSFDPLSGTPTIGFPTAVTLNLANEGVIDATGVSVTFPVPPGWAYVSDDTGGNYDPDTGVWTVGRSNSGTTDTVEFFFVPLATGPYVFTAEIAASNEPDLDSTPGNGVVGEDDQDSLSASPQMGAGTAPPTQTCSSGDVLTLDWDSETWAPGTRSASFTYSGIGVDLDITDPEGALDGTPNGPMPVAAPFYQGGLSGIESTLIFELDDAELANGDALTTLGFGQAVDQVRLAIFDIDFSDLGPRLERIEVRGLNGATPVAPILEGGSAISISGAQAVGVAESDSTGAASGAGTLTIAFDQPVDRVEIDFGHAPGTDRSSNPGNPGFAVHDISFCGGTALLTGSKSVAVYSGSATNPGLYAMPGEDVVYAITVENTGTGPSDANSIELVDLMPPEVSVYTGTTPEFGGAVVGWDETGTGLTFTPGTDIAYSNSTSGAPADFSACTYTPMAGYDPAITYVCFNPKGEMAAGSEFTISFRARIE